MTYIYTFLKSGTGLRTSCSSVSYFSIYFINVLSICRCICYLVFHTLFPSISMAVIDYTCITSVSEYGKYIKLLFKWIQSFLLWWLTLFYSPAYIRCSLNTIKRSRYGLQHDLLVLNCMLVQVHVLLFTLAHLLRK